MCEAKVYAYTETEELRKTAPNFGRFSVDAPSRRIGGRMGSGQGGGEKGEKGEKGA